MIHIVNWDYIAGFFDGEGCIRTDKQGRLHINFAQKQTTVLESIKSFLSEQGIVSHIYTTFDNQHHGPFYHLHVGGNVTSKRKFLEGINGRVIVKQEKVNAAIEFAKTIKVANFRPPYGERHEHQIVEMYQTQKLSLGAIANHFGRSIDGVAYVLEKYGIARRQHMNGANTKVLQMEARVA